MNNRVRIQVTYTRPAWVADGLSPRTSEYAGPRDFVLKAMSHLTDPESDFIILSEELL